MKERGGLIPRNAINVHSTVQITTAGTSLPNALFFDFTGNQMRTLVPAAGLVLQRALIHAWEVARCMADRRSRSEARQGIQDGRS